MIYIIFLLNLKTLHLGKDIKSLNRLIQNRKNAIRKVFLNTQNLIIQTCFTKEFNNISNLEDIKNFQDKLYNFKNVLCYTEDYNFYNEFYCNTMIALDSIREYIENNGTMLEYRNSNKNLLVVDNTNKFVKIFKTIIQKIHKLFRINITNNEKEFNMNLK